jgi:hypothetical protein
MSKAEILDRLSGLTFAEAEGELGNFDSYERSLALVFVLMRTPTPADAIRVFLEWGNVCDAPWGNRTHIADCLRREFNHVALADFLEAPARVFCDGLPALIPLWRGCERGRERGLHWTTDRLVAEGFATGKRCVNKCPTLVSAIIPKQRVFGVFVDRDENEVVVDPRRLQELSKWPTLQKVA